MTFSYIIFVLQHEASNHGFVEIVDILLKSGANVNTPGYDNDTALIDAIKMQQYGVAEVLLKNGADVNLRYMYILYLTNQFNYQIAKIAKPYWQ